MNEIVKSETKAVAKRDNISAIDLRATEYLNSLGFKFSPAESKRFLEICRAYQLNPFKREIYGIQGWDSEKGDILTIIVGYEVYLKRAERTGKLDGYEKTVDFDKDGNLFSATVTIYRKDWSHPFTHTIYANEFTRKKKDGTPMKMWATMPIFMLIKVCIAQAFRLCFPDEMGGLPLIAEEIDLIQEQTAPVGKPQVEMPQEKKSNAKEQTKTYEELSQIIGGCVNLSELEKEWKANAKSIKGLLAEDYDNLNTEKNLKKSDFESILKGEK